MDKYLSSIWSASAELEMLQFQTDQAHERLVQALCVAMAAQIPSPTGRGGRQHEPE